MFNTVTQNYLDRLTNNQQKLDKSKLDRYDLAEGMFPPSPAVIETLGTFSPQELSALPDRNSTQVRTAVAKFLGLAEDNIAVFGGADEIIEILPRMFVASGDNIIVVAPTFDRLIKTNQKSGGEVLTFNLKSSKNFELDDEAMEDLEKLIKESNPKLVWVCSPNNPTGVVVNIQLVGKLSSNHPETVFVVDEAYQEYFSLHPEQSASSLVNNNDNIVVIRSFSKAFGLAGVRIGYLVSSPLIATAIRKYQTMFGVSTIASKLAAIALKDIDHVKNHADFVRTQKTELERVVSTNSALEHVAGSQTNYLLIRHKKEDLFEIFLKNNMVTSDWRMAKGIENMGYVRVSIGQKSQNDKLKSFLSTIN